MIEGKTSKMKMVITAINNLCGNDYFIWNEIYDEGRVHSNRLIGELKFYNLQTPIISIERYFNANIDAGLVEIIKQEFVTSCLVELAFFINSPQPNSSKYPHRLSDLLNVINEKRMIYKNTYMGKHILESRHIYNSIAEDIITTNNIIQVIDDLNIRFPWNERLSYENFKTSSKVLPEPIKKIQSKEQPIKQINNERINTTPETIEPEVSPIDDIRPFIGGTVYNVQLD